MQSKRKNWLSLAVLAALMAVTGAVLLRDVSWTQLFSTVRQANPAWLVAGLGLMLLFVACEGVNLHLLLRTLDVRTPLGRCLQYAFVGFYFSSVTPSASGGQPAQVYYMSRDRIPPGRSSLCFLVIVVVYQVVMLGYGLLSFLCRPAFVLRHLGGIGVLVALGVAINLALIILILGLLLRPQWVRRPCLALLRGLHRLHLVRKVDQWTQALSCQIDEYQAGAAFLRRHPSVLPKVMGMTILQLGALFAVPYVVYRAFGLSAYGLGDVMTLQAILTIAVASLPLPGAVGASEGGFLRMFTLLFGPERLMPALLLSRGISFYGFLMISALVTAVVHLTAGRRPVAAPRRLLSGLTKPKRRPEPL